MRTIQIVLMIALFVFLTPMQGLGETVTLAFKTSWAEYTLAFDSNVISREEVKRLARISPNDFYALSIPDLEYCATVCSFNLRTGWRAPNYYQTAGNNVRKAKKELRYLENLSYPAELRPWVQYLLRFWAFNTWLEETLLEFYRTWDITVLKRKYDTLDPASSCSEPVRSIEAASADRDTQYMLAKFQWGTCMTEKYQSEIGAYPAEPWKNFLRNYHILEKVNLREDNSEDD